MSENPALLELLSEVTLYSDFFMDDPPASEILPGLLEVQFCPDLSKNVHQKLPREFKSKRCNHRFTLTHAQRTKGHLTPQGIKARFFHTNHTYTRVGGGPSLN